MVAEETGAARGWQDVLKAKGLAAAEAALQELGIESEDAVAHLDESLLDTLEKELKAQKERKLKPLQFSLLRKWVLDNQQAKDKPSSSAEDQLLDIKARTMYDLVDAYQSDSGTTNRILFLTNSQAEIIASQPNFMGIRRMVSALDLPQPKLVINIIPSWGFAEFTQVAEDWKGGGGRNQRGRKHQWGMVRGRSPFLSAEDEESARVRIDRFMLEVLIPLAERTNAIVVCEAVKQGCILAASLRRCAAINRRGSHPFTIISITSSTANFYCNQRQHDIRNGLHPKGRPASWEQARDESRAWKQRDTQLRTAVHKKWDATVLEHDLDSNAELLVVVDAMNVKTKEIQKRGPQASLVHEMVRYFASTVPSIILQTGASAKVTHEEASDTASSLSEALSNLQSGSPVIFLDVREREREMMSPPKVDNTVEVESRESAQREVENLGLQQTEQLVNRQVIIERAKAHFRKLGEQLNAQGLTDCFDTCAIALFHEALYGDPEFKTHSKPVALHDAINIAENGTARRSQVECPPANTPQVVAAASWLADSLAEHAWVILPKVKELLDADTEHWEREDLNESSIGIRWEKVMGSTKDKDSSKMLHNQKLSEALQSKTCFTLEEWKAFGIEENLSEDSFVKTIDDEFYFRPNCRARNLHRVVLRIMKYAMPFTSEKDIIAQLESRKINPENVNDAVIEFLEGVESTGKRQKRGLRGESTGSTPLETQVAQAGMEAHEFKIWKEAWKEEIQALSTHIRLILLNEDFHHLNLSEHQHGSSLDTELAQLDRVIGNEREVVLHNFAECVCGDRLPKATNLSGLLLLRQAWREYDVTVYLSKHYKRLSKVFFILQLVIGWLVVVASVLRHHLCHDSDVTASDVPVARADTLVCLTNFQNGIFFASILSSLILFTDNILLSTKRWRHLRSAAGALESTVWMYRGRAGPFHDGVHGVPGENVHASSSKTAEEVLSNILKQWMSDLTSGADLSRSSLEKIYPPRVYKHCQDSGTLPKENLDLHADLRDWQQASIEKDTTLDEICKSYSITGKYQRILFLERNRQVNIRRLAESLTTAESLTSPPPQKIQKIQDLLQEPERKGGDPTVALNEWAVSEEPAAMIWVLSKGGVDDYHSPLTPERYISLRLRPMMSFYLSRIPVYTKANFQMMVFLGLFSATASSLAYFKYADVVVVITTASAAITSYLEYADTQRKIERYTRAVRSIKSLLNWWATLDAVEKAGIPAISKVFATGEAIISEERRAWQPLTIGLSEGREHGGGEKRPALDIESGKPESSKTSRTRLPHRVHPSETTSLE